MTLSERIGLDLGTAASAGERAGAAAAVGAGIVRVRFPLGDRSRPDEAFLREAQAAVAEMRRAGLRVLAVVDGSLTVAPEGMGTFAERPPEALAQAWCAELTTNVGLLAEVIGDQVSAWEVLPAANVGSPARIAPVRWAALLAEVAAVIRAASPWATLIAGSLVSDESDDGVDYLRQAYRGAEAAGLWRVTAPPFDTVGLCLNILPDGGPSEEAVVAALTERTRRLWRVPEHFEGTEKAKSRGVFVTGLYWDAARVGDDVQARNIWTALNTLTADPLVRGVIWTGLVDSPTLASGLYRAESLADDDRRPAWQAFSDFAHYARQISPVPPPEVLLAPDEPSLPPEFEAVDAPEQVAAVAAAPGLPAEPEPEAPTAPDFPAAAEPEQPAAPVPTPDLSAAAELEPPEAEPVIFTAPDLPAAAEPEQPATLVPTPDLPAAAEPTLPLAGAMDASQQPTTADALEPAGAPVQAGDPPGAATEQAASIVFRIPDAAEVLRAQGLEGEKLTAALELVKARYGDLEWLPPGEYRVILAGTTVIQPPTPRYTNQQVISALYRAGGGTWSLFGRSGLMLSELTARRGELYTGPPLTSLELSNEEREALQRELGA